MAIQMETIDKKQLITDLIGIFRNPERYALLEQKCVMNTLLLHRCKEIHVLLNDRKRIIEKYEHYTTKIRWHIQRLYRIRNEITHSAFLEDKSLTLYIEHLYTYLSQLVSEVVYYVEHKQVNSIEEAFSTIVENYNTYMELLNAGHIEDQDILKSGVIDIIN